jgi:RNA polymerase sigma factor (sigma-70 family)
VPGTLQDDVQLVAGVLALTPGADVKLFAALEPSVRAAIARSGVAVQDREEVANEIRAKVWKNDWHVLRQWDQQARLGTYLLVVARNYCTDHVRKEMRRRVSTAGEDDLANVPDDHPLSNPTVLRLAGHVARCIARARALLSEGHNKVIALRYDDDLSYQGIADALGRSIGYVGTTLLRAERNLQESIHEVCPDLLDELSIAPPS